MKKENQTKEYLKGLNFTLKDKARTESKYKDYKTEKFKDTVNLYTEDINDYLFNLDEYIKTDLSLNPFRMDFLKLDQKTDIRHFKTLINSIAYKLNMEFIKGFECANKNEIRNFTILFYLAYYDRINEIMKSVLTDLVLDYPKNAIVKKLTVV